MDDGARPCYRVLDSIIGGNCRRLNLVDIRVDSTSLQYQSPPSTGPAAHLVTCLTCLPRICNNLPDILSQTQ